MDSDPASPPSRSRVCMICGPSGNEYHVFIVDIAIDECSLGDTHKIPPRAVHPSPDYSVDFADIDLSAFEEKTPDLVLVDFPPINVCVVDSVLCFFPKIGTSRLNLPRTCRLNLTRTCPSTDVFYLELPKIGTSSLNLTPHRVVYGEDGGMLKKAPLNLVSPKASPIVIRYGTRFLVFSTAIQVGSTAILMGISPESPGNQFEIYHPFSDPPLKDLPNLIIDGDYITGYKLYNLETKSFEPLLFSYTESAICLDVKSYSLIEHTFVLRTNLGMFCLDLENPMVKGWEPFLESRSITYWHGIRQIHVGIRQIHVAENGLKLEGVDVYKDGENAMFKYLPSSFMPIPVRKHLRLRACTVTLLDGFNYPRCTPCILQMQFQNGVGSYMILDVVRADLSKFELDNEEWAEIIHSFKFCIKRRIGNVYRCYGMFPI